MNPFAQRIGIYYKDFEWAQQVFCDIVNDCTPYIQRKSRNNAIIVLNDETLIRFLPANDSSRGQRFTKAFIQSGVDKKVYCCVIAPKVQNNECYMVDDYDDIRMFRKKPARSYYFPQRRNYGYI